ncbi:death-associated protein 1 [Folsomia candida]|nr:death-associated protein 1 [Folsomia candida]
MSSPEKSEGVAHPTAVKVGGMRITQNKSHLKDKKTDATVPQPEEGDALKVSTSPPKSAVSAVSGAPQKGNADFPKEAVQSFHDKPAPTHDKGAPSKPMVIHQPRK